MPFQKGNTLSGRTKGPDKYHLHTTILEIDRLCELVTETGYTQGEILDMLIIRARPENMKRKK